jgi:leucyl aminopeptidase
MKTLRHPNAHDQNKVGSYPTIVYSGGGLIYDEVLEYRVWLKDEDRQSRCHSFVTYNDAKRFIKNTPTAEREPVVLVLQKQYIEDNKDGKYKLIDKERFTEWRIEWLKGSKRTPRLINAILRKNDQ